MTFHEVSDSIKTILHLDIFKFVKYLEKVLTERGTFAGGDVPQDVAREPAR